MKPFVVFLLFLALQPFALSASSAVQSDWDVDSELGASLFFGNTRQATVTTRGSASRTDSILEWASDMAFTYGEATNKDGVEFVNKRSWALGTSLDYKPQGNSSPYLSGRVQSSHEKRIHLRYEAGVGGKLTMVRNSKGIVDFSVALLAERTIPIKDEDASEDSEDVTQGRWSARLRFRRDLQEGRVSLKSETLYKPVFDEFGNYTVNSENSVAFALTDVVSLKFTFVDQYDSGALSRGARTNNDGQLFFSVLSRFR